MHIQVPFGNMPHIHQFHQAAESSSPVEGSSLGGSQPGAEWRILCVGAAQVTWKNMILIFETFKNNVWLVFESGSIP